MNRPQSKARKPQFLCIVGCEGKNQERLYFDRIAQLINNVEERTQDLVFDYAEPYGGNPKCVVERTIEKSIVSAKYSCGFSNTLISSIIVGERYLNYFTTITEDRLWQLLAKPVFRWRNSSGLSMNVAKAA